MMGSAMVPGTVGHDGSGITVRKQETGSGPLPCSRLGPGLVSDTHPPLSGANTAAREAEIQPGPCSKENFPVVGTSQRPRLFINMSNVYIGMHAFLTKISFHSKFKCLILLQIHMEI